MNNFVFRSVGFAVVLVGVLALVHAMAVRLGGENFQHAIFDKHAALSENDLEERGRIILIGGSNVTFGMYSPLLEKAFGLKTINSALSAGYGLRFILNDVAPYIRQDDILIISPEYFHFVDEQLEGGGGLPQIVFINPESISHLTQQQMSTVISETPHFVVENAVRIIRSKTSGTVQRSAYDRDVFNENFDVVGHWDLPPTYISDFSLTGKFNVEACNILANFCASAEEQGAQCYFAYPSFISSALENSDASLIREIEEGIRSLGFPVLGNMERYSFADSLYYNSHYHLHKAGQLLRTEYLIEDLRAAGCCP